MAGVDHGAERGGRVERVPVLVQRAALFDELGGEFFNDALVHQQAGAGAAHLARVAEDAVDGVLDSAVEVFKIREENLRGLATAFQADALHVRAPGIFQHALAGDRGAREGNLGHVVVQRERFAGGQAETVHHVEHTRRATGLDEQFGEQQGGQRRLFRGLQHYGVAGGQGRGHLPAGHHERVVPGNHTTDHAERFTQGVVEGLYGGVRDRTLHFVDEFAEIAHRERGLRNVHAGHFAHWLAHGEGVQQGEAGGVGIDEVCPARHDPHAIAGGHAAPTAIGMGLLGGGDGQVDIGGVARGDLAQRLAGGRVHQRVAAVARGHLLAVDEVAGVEPEGSSQLLPFLKGLGSVHGL